MHLHHKRFSIDLTTHRDMTTVAGCLGAIPILGPMDKQGKRAPSPSVRWIGDTPPLRRTADDELQVSAHAEAVITNISYHEIMTTLAHQETDDNISIELTPAQQDQFNEVHRNQTNSRERGVVDIELTFAATCDITTDDARRRQNASHGTSTARRRRTLDRAV